MEFKTLYDSIMARNAKKRGIRTYKLNRATGIWQDNQGNSYRLDDHGCGRIDLIPIPRPEPTT